MSLGQLDTNLRRLYAGARNKTVDVYSKSLTLLGFRHKGLKLASDPRFKTSNKTLNATVVSFKRRGKEGEKTQTGD